MDETAFFLDMNSERIIEFTGKKNVKILTSGREKYRVSVILAVTGDGYKLSPLVIFKGEEGKSIEKNLRKLPFVNNDEMYIHCRMVYITYLYLLDKRGLYTLSEINF